jgi:hypothetical protein
MGPEEGAWSPVGPGSLFDWDGSGPYEVEYESFEPHGFSIGDTVAHFRGAHVYEVWSASASVVAGEYYRPTTSTGTMRYKCVLGGTTGGSEPSWNASLGSLTLSGTAAFQCVGDQFYSPINGNFTVTDVPTTTTLRWEVPSMLPDAGMGYIANLSTVYLADFVNDETELYSSAPLTGKSILDRGVIDVADFSMTPAAAGAADTMWICEVAALEANSDLATSAQRLIAFYDTLPELPVEWDTGDTVSFSISNTADRLVRF